MRPTLQRIVDELLAQNTEMISLDALGDALGDSFVTTDEIDAMIAAIETAGRNVGMDDEGRGIERLRGVLAAARTLREELGRSPSTDEICRKTGLSAFAVRHALGLARVMQR